MKPWRLAKSLVVLRAEVNKTYPNRPKNKDGTIGDEAHQADRSDHNPNPPHDGVVTAWDITTDPTFTDALAAKLRAMAKASDGRVKYVIFKGRYASAKTKWAWTTYTGRSKHFDHIHLSVSNDPKQYDRTDPWHAFASPAVTAHSTSKPTKPLSEDDVTPEDRKAIVDDVVAQVKELLLLEAQFLAGRKNGTFNPEILQVPTPKANT